MKSNDALKKIGEVSRELKVPIHVIRFWEKKFSDINPIKKPNGTRYFNQNQLRILKNIKSLLYDKKFSIEGAKRFLKNQSKKKDEQKKLIYEIQELINEIKKKI
jgi:DNA-binding transcriptional MerR regulator